MEEDININGQSKEGDDSESMDMFAMADAEWDK